MRLRPQDYTVPKLLGSSYRGPFAVSRFSTEDSGHTFRQVVPEARRVALTVQAGLQVSGTVAPFAPPMRPCLPAHLPSAPRAERPRGVLLFWLE